MERLTISDCTKRKLDNTYLVVYAIKNEINIKKGDYIEKEDIYTFVGIDKRGFRTLINVYSDRKNNNRYWLDCFESLKTRGIRNILFLSVDNNKNLKRSAKVAFPNIIFTDSLTDIMPKFYQFSYEKSAKEIGSKIRDLYIQNTITDYKETFKKFKERYNNVIHQKLIEKYLNNIELLYKYSLILNTFSKEKTLRPFIYKDLRVFLSFKKCVHFLFFCLFTNFF